ncbi:hypothetical protein AVEN_115953-1 [Araneus ventricosus]|uniref:Uncharacterized protein n=1 Tax=Araneus ventricosus TaxID=182803 RepID=A0A4Y2KWI5_ARAVE|nr:hypothetical protein AVEN_115953-1 [Araneus ventricosus]
MKGIAEDVYQALLTKEIRTTADFINWCQHIEEMQQRRIGHTKFIRLPNVVPIASIDAENDLTSLILIIVQEEIQKLTVPQAMEPQMDIQSIETIVREEPQTEGTLEQSPRKTDLWRTIDNRPSAFIVDVLDTLFATAETAELFSTVIAEIKNETFTRNLMTPARTAKETSRQTTRSPSPHPNRGRSPIRRYRSLSPYRRSSQSPGRRNEEN